MPTENPNLPVFGLPKSAKDLEGVRGFLGQVKQLCSTSTIYEGPLRTMFDELGAKLEAALAALPKTTDANWSVNDQAEQLFNLLACCNSVVASLGLELGKVKATMAGMVVLDEAITAGKVIAADKLDGIVAEKVTSAVAATITQRTGETGDLVTRDTMLSMCSASEAAGLAKGLEQAAAKLAADTALTAKAAERTTALTTAGIALPAAEVEAILRAEDAAFETAKALVTDRRQKLTAAGIELTPDLMGKLWLAEAEYKTFESTVKTIPALKKAVKLDEPLATGFGGGTGGHRILM